MKNLTRKQSRYLRSLAHQLKPVVTVGNNGMSDAVLAELELALDTHELVKLKLRGDRDNRAAWIARASETSGAIVVQTIGQVCCLYRPHPKDPQLTLPA
ncbi:MAG: ribosome assembly RNA-binding protein YhbY [Lysobacterales bacterium]